MPRAGLRDNRDAQEIGATIVAYWFKVLPTAVPITHIVTLNPLVVELQWPNFVSGQLVFIHNAKGLLTLATAGLMPLKAGSVATLPVPGSTDHQTVEVLDNAGGAVDGTNFKDFLDKSVMSAEIGKMQPLDSEIVTTMDLILKDKTVKVVYDESIPGQIYVAMPRIPDGVYTRQDLMDYLETYHKFGQGRHYHEELGTAVLYGCK